MSLPRMLIAGSTYLVTRRCSERRYFLRPSKLTDDVFEYCLALAALKTGVLLHAWCVLSNHFHLVATDPDAKLPEFMQWLDSFVARALNASYGRWENLWAPGSYSAVRLESRESVLDKIVYTLANPVSSGLVRFAHDWPGLWSSPSLFGAEPRLVVRPQIFFDSDGPLPLLCPLALVRPPQFADLTDADFADLVQHHLDQRQKTLQDEADAQGQRFLGRKTILEQDPFDSPDTVEPRRQLNPRVAEKDPERRIAALKRLMQFWLDYREAWLRLKARAAGVVFPAGTYWLRVHLAVPCVPSA